MNCYCCGKPLKSDVSTNWHKACIKRFFGTSSLPEIEITEDTLNLLAVESTTKGYTVPGVQKKLSLHFFSDDTVPRLTLVNYPTGYILKPQVTEYEALPEAEHLIMSMADLSGIITVPHALLENNHTYSYITKRVDRITDTNHMGQLAMEDFCQLDLRLTEDKYRGSYERCAKIIAKYSSQKMFDLTELFLRLVFCFIVGNSDMHLKNFSLIETEEKSNLYKLSPAYDLLPVNIILPEDKEQFALSLNGKKHNIRKKDFIIFATNCGISESSAKKMIAQILSKKERYLEMCESSLLPQSMKHALKELIESRCEVLL